MRQQSRTLSAERRTQQHVRIGSGTVRDGAQPLDGRLPNITQAQRRSCALSDHAQTEVLAGLGSGIVLIGAT